MDKHTRIRLNNLAIRNFRDTADLDYIHARLAFRHNLIPQLVGWIDEAKLTVQYYIN